MVPKGSLEKDPSISYLKIDLYCQLKIGPEDGPETWPGKIKMSIELPFRTPRDSEPYTFLTECCREGPSGTRAWIRCIDIET